MQYDKKAASKLPNKLSDLLDLAVRDAKRCEKMKTRELDMGVWFCPNRFRDSKKCGVCMAGAIMDRTLRIKSKDELSYLEDLPDDIASKMAHVDDMRQGCFAVEGSEEHSLATEKAGALIRDNFDLESGRAPWRIYTRAAKILREAGL